MTKHMVTKVLMKHKVAGINNFYKIKLEICLSTEIIFYGHVNFKDSRNR